MRPMGRGDRAVAGLLDLLDQLCPFGLGPPLGQHLDGGREHAGSSVVRMKPRQDILDLRGPLSVSLGEREQGWLLTHQSSAAREGRRQPQDAEPFPLGAVPAIPCRPRHGHRHTSVLGVPVWTLSVLITCQSASCS
jgi:hypothetical protein